MEMDVDAHSGIREMMLFPGSQLDCGVSVLPEEFLHLEFLCLPLLRMLWCLVSGVSDAAASPAVGVLQSCFLFSRTSAPAVNSGEQNSIKTGLLVEEEFHAAAQRHL